MKTLKNMNYINFLALMTAFAVSLYFFEMLIPQPLPFMKIGLSNIVVLSLIYSLYAKEALFVATVKSVLGAFFTGTLISPAFLLSVTGACFSCIMMFLTFKYLKNLSIIGLSVIGAFTHLLAQLFMVRLVILQTNSIFSLYPLIVLSAVITGFITGLFAYILLNHINLRSMYDKTCD